MNKTAIKNYAILARVQLIETVKQRAFEYEITEDGENKTGLDTIGGRLLSNAEKEQRNQLIELIRQNGYAQTMEEAAYTWFNRFIALRFMEVNGYLPSKIRVFTDESGAFKPEIMKEAMSVELDGLDRNKVVDLLDKQDNEALYKYLLITQCNALNKGLPYMFEKIGGWTELLFPTHLLRQDSVIGTMIASIPEEDWMDAVQIIGWLYQYYNSELKDETFALLKKNVKITKERIPAATQLFTPDWIVRYMVENSLGRLWYEGHKDFDKSKWRYYLVEAEQEPEVELQLQKIREEYSRIKPEEITVIDPCMGSGHILVYAFDVLMQIYTAAGWSERDAARSIIENNLYGLDIDDRAGQLAYFAVMMKARKHNRRILNGEVTPNVISIQESNWMTDDFITYVAGKDTFMRAELTILRKTFKDAKEYGSILNAPIMQYGAIYDRIDEIRNSYAEDLFQSQYQKMSAELLLPLVKQSQMMLQKYDVVVTNPPYMGGANMNVHLLSFVQKYYPDSKMDLYSVFIDKMYAMGKQNAYLGVMTSYTWMFLTSFEEFRKKTIQNNTLVSLIQPEYHSFFESANVPVCTYVLQKGTVIDYAGSYINLSAFYGADSQSVKCLDAIEDNNCSYRYTAKQSGFFQIPGVPIAYWVGKTIIDMFKKGLLMCKFADLKQGLITGDNDRFLRQWQECDKESIYVGESTGSKWFFFHKGGEYRKWYGNISLVVNWENNGEEIINFKDENGKQKSRPQNVQYYLKEGFTWTSLTVADFNVRYMPEGAIFAAKGSAGFCKEPDNLNYLIGLCNSKVSMIYLSFLAPTMDYNNGSVAKVPTLIRESDKENVTQVVKSNISISKNDWDSFETSWDFKKHPLV